MDPAPMFELIPYQRFRDTPAVRFFDVTIADSNARDLVIHAGPAVSPPDDSSGAWQFYLHPHQEDNLLAVQGGGTSWGGRGGTLSDYYGSLSPKILHALVPKGPADLLG